MREAAYNQYILTLIDNVRQEWRLNAMNLGGTSGSGGGSGGPPGGFVGILPQTKVAGDTTESFAFSSGSQSSLLNNLNNIRAWEMASAQFYATHTDPISTHLNVSSGSWHYSAGVAPVLYGSGVTPDISAPASGTDRYDLLTVNISGTLSWTHGTPAAIPVEPSLPTPTSGSMPLWMIYARSSGSCIQQHNDSVSHYVFRDYRPQFEWGIGGAGGTTTGSTPYSFRWYVDGAPSVASNVAGIYYLPADFTPSTAEAYLRTPNTSGSLVADIQYSTDATNWYSLFSDVNNRLTLSSGSSTSRSTIAQPLHQGDLLKLDIDQVGVTGSSLTVNLIGSELGVGGTTSPVSLDATLPADVGSSAVTGTSGSAAHGNHVHRGVVSLNKSGSAALYGGVTLSQGTNVTLTQSSNDISVAIPAFSASSPADVGSAAVVGTSGLIPNSDHVHRGIASLLFDANPVLYGAVSLSAGTNVTFAQVGNAVTVSAPATGIVLDGSVPQDVAATAAVGVSANAAAGDHIHKGVAHLDATSPVDITTAAAVGTSGSASHGDHTHRGVTSVNASGGTYAYGHIELLPGTNITLSQSSGSITINSTASGGASLDATSPVDVGSAASVGTSGSASHGDHVHRGVTSVSAAGGAYAYGNVQLVNGANITLSQSSGSITIASTASGGAGRSVMYGYAAASIGPSTTDYIAFGGAGTNIELDQRQIVPFAATISKFYLRTATSQDVSGSLVLTIMKNGVATAVTITIAAGSAAGLFSDLTHSFTTSAGDGISIEMANNATNVGGSATVEGYSIEIDAT